MTTATALAISARQNGRIPRAHPAVHRWECDCQLPPILLGTYVPGESAILKFRDRFYWIDGRVRTACPRCGVMHDLDPQATDTEMTS